VAIRPILENGQGVQFRTRLATTMPWQLFRRLTRPFSKQGVVYFGSNTEKEILRGYESQISELEQIDYLEWADRGILFLQKCH
jgi:hypothetical protein